MRTLLANEIDKLPQYLCRTCIVIDYITKKTKKVLTCNIEFNKKEEIKDIDVTVSDHRQTDINRR